MSLALGLSLNTASGPSAARIQMTNYSVPDGAASGTVVGTLSVASGTGSYTLSITSDPDNVFDLSGSDLITTADMDITAADFHTVTIQASNGVDDPITRGLTIEVRRVA